jgi:hypothetical protein
MTERIDGHRHRTACAFGKRGPQPAFGLVPQKPYFGAAIFKMAHEFKAEIAVFRLDLWTDFNPAQAGRSG